MNSYKPTSRQGSKRSSSKNSTNSRGASASDSLYTTPLDTDDTASKYLARANAYIKNRTPYDDDDVAEPIRVDRETPVDDLMYPGRSAS